MIINLCSIDWVAISALATAIMAVITGASLWQNRKQLDELKRQWKESTKPIVVLETKIENNTCYLKISNLGIFSVMIDSIAISEKSKENLLSFYGDCIELDENNMITHSNFVISPKGNKCLELGLISGHRCSDELTFIVNYNGESLDYTVSLAIDE